MTHHHHQDRLPKHAPPPGTVLAFAPHGDDEILGCGGALWMHAERGDAVHVVVIFDGALGHRLGAKASADATLVALRRAETRAAGRSLGPLSYEFLGLPEGHHPPRQILARGAGRLAERLRALDPATVYAPWRRDGHRDHRTTSRGVRLALEAVNFRGEAHGYAVWTPLPAETRLDISAAMDARRAALDKHRSQGGSGALGEHMEALALASGIDQDGGPFGEVFCALGAADPEDREELYAPGAVVPPLGGEERA
ncbi:MAG: PIG-L deacetylase family protein [Planctomycetota bacterium]|jgi:LmbE family N-acetylglucosaminyl deacetylase|nr:PIG-L deacetylase family protein [Planctomycetota bacterium]